MKSAHRVPVLMYHRVGPVRDRSDSRYCVTASRFAAQMLTLKRQGHRAVPVDALVAWLSGGPPLNEGDFVLTFDDGYLGVLEHALPVLEAVAWPCTVFLVTARLGGRDDWPRNDGVAAGSHRLLDAEQILDMQRRGCTFYSHTRTHNALTALNDAALSSELQGSREAIRALTGHDGHYLAYPYGRVDDRVEAAARAAGYTAAFSTRPGFNRCDVNPMRIRRLDVWGSDTPAMLLRKIRLGGNDGSVPGMARYYWRLAVDRLRRARP